MSVGMAAMLESYWLLPTVKAAQLVEQAGRRLLFRLGRRGRDKARGVRIMHYAGSEVTSMLFLTVCIFFPYHVSPPTIHSKTTSPLYTASSFSIECV
jgi:hypothetical protein